VATVVNVGAFPATDLGFEAAFRDGHRVRQPIERLDPSLARYLT
jgi:hypothetical protein